MDAAVSLVQTYLRVNGYFTVTEFPVVEAVPGADYRTATDLDLLACRFPGASQTVVSGDGEGSHPIWVADPALAIPEGTVDMIVGEVKESAAEFNPGGLRADVLAVALERFGCCRAGAHARQVVATLLSTGQAETGVAHVVRLVAFGAKTGRKGPYRQVGLDRVVKYLERYVRENWDVISRTQSKDPALSFLMLQEKARRGARGGG